MEVLVRERIKKARLEWENDARLKHEGLVRDMHERMVKVEDRVENLEKAGESLERRAACVEEVCRSMTEVVLVTKGVRDEVCRVVDELKEKGVVRDRLMTDGEEERDIGSLKKRMERVERELRLEDCEWVSMWPYLDRCFNAIESLEKDVKTVLGDGGVALGNP